MMVILVAVFIDKYAQFRKELCATSEIEISKFPSFGYFSMQLRLLQSVHCACPQKNIN